MKNKYNLNIKQCNKHLNDKNWRKTGNIIMYRYKNNWQEHKILKNYTILSKVR